MLAVALHEDSIKKNVVIVLSQPERPPAIGLELEF